MNLFFEQLHFLRPDWLWAIALILPVVVLLWRQHKNTGQWQHLISPELLPFLLEGKTVKTSRSHLFALMLAWVISSIALAGPSWKKLPVAVEKNSNAMVIILDLSPSMLTEDIKPSRIVRARLKITDILREREDGQTALLVYGADAHVVTPLTDDSKTITNLLPMLSPNLMPTQGSNTEAAIERAVQLLHDAGLHWGDLLLVSDGVTKDAQKTIIEKLSTETGIRLSILGVGGLTPAPIPSRNGGFLRDKQNNIVTSFLDAKDLNQFAQKNRGRYKTLSTNVSDIHAFTQLPEIKIEKNDEKKIETANRTFDQWTDEGHWLVLLLIPIALYGFRRGTLNSLAIIFILPFACMTPQTSYAMDWNGLWKNQNQQAYEKLQAEKASEAAKQFTQPDWKASAEYRAENFDEAAKQFATDDTAKGHYNQGNALAKSGKLEEALKAYDQALKLDPELEDAKKNRKIVEDALKKQQEQKQQNKDQNKQDQNKQDQNQENKDQDQQKQDQNQQNKDQQQDDQKQKDQKQSDQQSSDQSQQNGQDSSAGQNSSEQNQSKLNSENSSESNQSMNQPQQEQMTSSSTAQEQSSAMSAAEKNNAKKEDKNKEDEKTKEEKQKEAKALAEQQKDGLTDEERKNLEQWLRRVQDDPSGLLRRKFEYESRKRQSEKYNGTWEAPNNEADQRL